MAWKGCLDDLVARGLRAPVLCISDGHPGRHEEFRGRVKTQGSLPGEDAALLFSLVASGQIKLRRIDGWRKIAAVLSQHTAVAA